ncbi:hypothetical protein SAMN06265365_101457 [Tistlia consotensis]|uniref:Uncharacterized protein n=1 Tax=Tistlia consotensis USBA 355 TaxID=560819 RepID=A0A1Y6B937_9PROT|nr:hypothetical protein SAMN05428998_101455 [Tistlia consotensis USBA 355]SNR27737.1 hypothetical protein SAMN06265365_101457 [Tistlia consotensis]
MSARPTAGFVDSPRRRLVEGPQAPRDQRPEDSRREQRDGRSAPPTTQAVLTLLPSDAAPSRRAADAGSLRTPQQEASEAYRKAGAEPPRYGEEPRIFSVTA